MILYFSITEFIVHKYLLFLHSYFLFAIIYASYADIVFGRVPNSATFVIACTGFIIRYAYDEILLAFLGGMIGLFILIITHLTFYKIRKIDALGGGDIKLSGAVGVWVGIEGIAPMILIASSTGLLYLGGLALAGRHITRTTSLRFAPFLCGAALLVWIVQRHDLF